MIDARANRPPSLPPPTIGYLRAQGVRGLNVACAASSLCHYSVNLTFDVLDLPDDTPFPSIAIPRRWVCAKCGSRKVSVMPQWPYR